MIFSARMIVRTGPIEFVKRFMGPQAFLRFFCFYGEIFFGDFRPAENFPIDGTGGVGYNIKVCFTEMLSEVNRWTG